jgi:hypothetical protein
MGKKLSANGTDFIYVIGPLAQYENATMTESGKFGLEPIRKMGDTSPFADRE